MHKLVRALLLWTLLSWDGCSFKLQEPFRHNQETFRHNCKCKSWVSYVQVNEKGKQSQEGQVRFPLGIDTLDIDIICSNTNCAINFVMSCPSYFLRFSLNQVLPPFNEKSRNFPCVISFDYNGYQSFYFIWTRHLS